jgi:oligopeptide/dipeptide ABC transporter ATP-binding protein
MSNRRSAAVSPSQQRQQDADQHHPVTVRMQNLGITIPTPGGTVQPTDNVSIDVSEGEVLGIVGETGSGKTVTARAMLGLMPTSAATSTGSVTYPGVVEENILGLGQSRLRRYWGDFISMIPQNPMTSLDPVHQIGDQISEAVAAHSRLSRQQREARVIELMRQVGIPAPKQRARAYPHQFSGGMLQRTLIAIALAGDPQVLIADEPTTALDVIIQDQILQLLLDLQRSRGMSLVLISHDLGVIAQTCDRVVVMYAGQIVELAPTHELLHNPKHPYTAALLRSMPSAVPADEPLANIPGAPPRLIGTTSIGCRFAPRCDFVEQACLEWHTELLPVQPEHTLPQVRCRRHTELKLAGAFRDSETHEPLPLPRPFTPDAS